jgi:hypothetical protein
MSPSLAQGLGCAGKIMRFNSRNSSAVSALVHVELARAARTRFSATVKDRKRCVAQRSEDFIPDCASAA